jgi:arginyl-tRNA synthetase
MKEKIISLLKAAVGDGGVGAAPDLSVPDEPKFGHYSTNVAMRLAKARGVAPLELARELAAKIEAAAPAGFFEKVEAAAPGFINFWLNAETVQKEFAGVAREKDFGKSDVGDGEKVIVEYSSVNIAKPFHLGHLRNTIIGQSIANILEASGYDVVRWNYIGDWGTQFGKLIAAYKRWGKKEDVERQPIEELQKLYVRFHQEMEFDPELEKQGQIEFQKLEAGDKENRKLWEWFKKESLAEFEKIYKELGVDFDVWAGESFFEEEMKPLVAELLKSGIAERSEGAVVVRLDEFNLQPALVEKTDGASLYLTRDIANLRYRLKKYKPTKILYVVGNEQSFQFEQLFAVAKKLGIDGVGLKHLKYGLVLGEAGKKLSTRRGEAIAVKDVFSKAIDLSRGVVEEKARDLSAAEKDDVARAIGIGALKYNDLKENRMTDIVFDWDKMLDFTGDSGPYLQYAYARLRSILRKASDKPKLGDGVKKLDSDIELALMRKIFELPDVVEKAGELYATSILAAYLYKLAVASNQFYETTPILKDDDAARRGARLMLAEVAARTIKSGLALLGIETPEKI